VREAVDALNAAGERVGVVALRLYRPFPTAQFLAALPPSTRTVVVLDRTKEPGAPFEPMHLDVSRRCGTATLPHGRVGRCRA
jgi:pyruvate-ferredoxin/flavodoxin oxidoreductase